MTGVDVVSRLLRVPEILGHELQVKLPMVQQPNGGFGGPAFHEP